MIEEVRRLLAGYEPKHTERTDAHPAAVLLPLYQRDGRQHVVVTKRSHLVAHHKGEISFPGGARDPGDPDDAYTALREAYEEVGIRPEDVDVLGRLDDFVTVSNFRVAPIVGAITRSPYTWVAHDHEVALVIEIPVAHLLAEGSYTEERRVYNGRTYNHVTYEFEGHVVWGATAYMLHQFLELLRAAGISG